LIQAFEVARTALHDPKIKSPGRDAALQSIKTARKTLVKSERTVDRVARHIQRTERVLHRIRARDRFRLES
jgi:hypothetical protein